MGLDACVYCNCYELGRLREPPPHAEYVRVAVTGELFFDFPATKNGQPLSQIEQKERSRKSSDFLKWEYSDRRCEHDHGVLIEYRLGNIGGIGALRDELSREAAKFPILLEKVLYSGTHSADFLPLNLVKDLKPELEALKNFECQDPDMAEYVDEFRQQIIELVEASLSVSKPICF